MKTAKLFTAILVAVLTLSVSAFAQDKKKNNKLEEITFSVFIDCEQCKKKCEALLPYIKGVKDVNVSLENQTIWFKYDPAKVTKQKLGAELAELGYPGKEIVKEEAEG